MAPPRDPIKRYGKPLYFDGTEPYCPQEWTPPLSPDAPSDGPRAIALAKKLHKQESGKILKLDDFQTKLICSILELYPEGHERAGEYRFKQAIVSIPRRNGKSTVASVLAQFSLIMSETPNIGVLASTKEQAKEVFDAVKYNFENHPALKERFRCTQHKGIESRRSDRPAHFKIHAGNGDSLQGIGFEGIIPVVVDELHITKAQAYDAAVKGASTGNQGPVIGITTAGTDDSELLKRLYVTGRTAIEGGEDANPRFGFWHWYVPSDVPLWDRDALLRANPAAHFGRLDIDQEILNGKGNPSSDYAEYRRYRRNEFVSSEEIWLGLDVWAQAAGEGIPEGATGSLVFAIDKDSGWNWATITAATKIDEVVYTETVARIQNPTLEWLEQYCLHLFNNFGAHMFIANNASLRDLVLNLRDQHGLPAEYLTEQQMSTATTSVAKMIANKRVVHNDSPIIKKQLPRTVTTTGVEGVKINIMKSTGAVDAVRSTVMAVYFAEKSEISDFSALVF